MRTRLRHVWEVLTSGYWFIPTVMMVGAAALAFLLLYLDRTAIGTGGRLEWLYSGGAGGAKTLLSALAGSIITVAGVVFSITIAALTQASSQFGPRLLRNFMSDTGNQVVLGTFVATFVYCLLVLRTIHDEVSDVEAFVPQASVTVAVLLAAVSIVVLIYFIHHVSMSLQAPSVVAAVREDLERVIARLPDDQQGTGVCLAPSDANGLPHDFDAGSRAVTATVEGYVQAVDYDGLMEAAEKADVVLHLDYRPGDFVICGSRLMRAWPSGRCDAELCERLNGAFICGRHSTPEQDVEHGIRQMVEVAVRALSPGINDPFTAINCVDALGSALCGIARRGLAGPMRYDGHGRLRLVTPVTTFAGVADTAFNQIRQYGAGSVAVTMRLLEVITLCGRQATSDDQRQALLRHANMVYRQGMNVIGEQDDRADVRHRWEMAVRVLVRSGAPPAEPIDPHANAGEQTDQPMPTRA